MKRAIPPAGSAWIGNGVPGGGLRVVGVTDTEDWDHEGCSLQTKTKLAAMRATTSFLVQAVGRITGAVSTTSPIRSSAGPWPVRLYVAAVSARSQGRWHGLWIRWRR